MEATGKEALLGEAVRRTLAAHGEGGQPLNLGEAARRAGLRTADLAQMAHGRGAGADEAARFACVFGEDVAAYLRLAGFPFLAAYLSGGTVNPATYAVAEEGDEEAKVQRLRLAVASLEDTVTEMRHLLEE